MKKHNNPEQLTAEEIVRGFILTSDMSGFDEYLINLQISYFAMNRNLAREHKRDCIYYFNELRGMLAEMAEFQNKFQQEKLKAA